MDGAASEHPASDHLDPCLNCEATLRPGDEYCSRCGQRNLPSKLALWELIREVLVESFDLDGRVFRTLLPFLFKPGFLSVEYCRGRRAAYTSPFRLFLAATFLWLASGFVVDQRYDFETETGAQDVIQVDASAADGGGGFSRWLVEQGQHFDALPEAEQARQLSAAASAAVPKAALAMTPVFALLLMLLFARSGRYYVEHLVFALHVHAFGFVLAALALPLFGVRPVPLLAMALLLVYLYVGLWTAYETRWWTAVLRLIVLLMVHSVVLTLASATIILATIMLG